LIDFAANFVVRTSASDCPDDRLRNDV